MVWCIKYDEGMMKIDEMSLVDNQNSVDSPDVHDSNDRTMDSESLSSKEEPSENSTRPNTSNNDDMSESASSLSDDRKDRTRDKFNETIHEPWLDTIDSQQPRTITAVVNPDMPGASSSLEEQSTTSTASTAPTKESSDDSVPQTSETRFYKLKSKVVKRHYRSKSNETDSVSGRKKARDGWTSSSNNSSPLPETSDARISVDKEEESDSDDERSDQEKMDDSAEWTTVSEEEEQAIPPVLKKEKPKHKWFAMSELLNRERGNNYLFDRKFHGSLNAMQRLEFWQKLEGHEGCVNALHFNEAGNLIASGSDDTKVIVWDWALGKSRKIYSTGHTMNIFEVKWLPIANDSMIVTCSRDGQVRLLDVNAATDRKLGSHREEARSLAIHPDHPCGVLSAGDDGKVFSLDIRAPKPTKLLTVKENNAYSSLYSVNINPRNSNEFCVAGYSQWVKIYDRRHCNEPIQQKTPPNLSHQNKDAYATSAVYNYNGTEIVVSYNDDDIYLFDTALPHPNGDYAHKYSGHRNNATIKSVNFFGPKSEFITSGSDCGNIFFWDKNTEAIVQWVNGDDEGSVNCIESHPHVPVLASSGLDYDVKIWMPSGDGIQKPEDLAACVKNNLECREEESMTPDDQYSTQVLLFFLRSIRQHGRRMYHSRSRANARNNQFDDDDDDDDEDDDDDDNDDDSDDLSEPSSSSDDESSDSQSESEPEGRLQCAPS